MKTGRPSKLSPEVMAAFIDSLEKGNYLETAAAYAGIARQTIYDWMRKGARGEGQEYVEFLDTMKKAQAQAEVAALDRIERAGEWQAAAWRLERKFPARWGQRVRVTVDQEQAAFLDRLEQRLPPAVYQQVLAAAAMEGLEEAEEEDAAPLAAALPVPE